MSNYITIKPCSISDGLGVRVAVYLSGCKWHCRNCQNPMTWDENAGQPVTDKTLEEIYNLLNNSYINGITLTGGDPLTECNLQTTNNIIDMVRSRLPEKDIWLYTGFEYKYICKANDKARLDIINKVDVLVDGPYIDELRDITYKYAGSTNQNIIPIKDKAKFDILPHCTR